MKKVLAVCLMAVALAGCEVVVDVGEPILGKPVAAHKEYPTVNLPHSLRQENWDGPNGEGSCVHATMVSLFRWQGHPAMADHWHHTYGDGEVADDEWDPRDNLVKKMEREGVRYAYTTKGDVSFLQWACDTRRGCGITVLGGKHMVALVHFDDKWAGILDNNDISHIIWLPRDQLISEWQNSNGWAVAIVYTPSPPLP